MEEGGGGHIRPVNTEYSFVCWILMPVLCLDIDSSLVSSLEKKDTEEIKF